MTIIKQSPIELIFLILLLIVLSCHDYKQEIDDLKLIENGLKESAKEKESCILRTFMCYPEKYEQDQKALKKIKNVINPLILESLDNLVQQKNLKKQFDSAVINVLSILHTVINNEYQYELIETHLKSPQFKNIDSKSENGIYHLLINRIKLIQFTYSAMKYFPAYYDAINLSNLKGCFEIFDNNQLKINQQYTANMAIVLPIPKEDIPQIKVENITLNGKKMTIGIKTEVNNGISLFRFTPTKVGIYKWKAYLMLGTDKRTIPFTGTINVTE